MALVIYILVVLLLLYLWWLFVGVLPLPAGTPEKPAFPIKWILLGAGILYVMYLIATRAGLLHG
jgi:hypothetical protein